MDEAGIRPGSAQCLQVGHDRHAGRPYLEESWTPGFKRRMRIGPPFMTPFGFADFLAALEQEISLFGKPVALAHGDTHFFRVDKPLRFASDQRVYENFIRVETFGSPHLRWVP